MTLKKSSFNIFLQARFDSKRLPGKALRHFPEKNLLNFLIKRLKKNIYKIPVILLTTKRPIDRKLIKIAKQNNIPYHAGSHSVLKRFFEASKKFKSKNIIRICGDNPLTDVKFLEECVRKFDKSNIDHLSTFSKPEVPYGTGCAIFKTSLLEKYKDKKLTSYESETFENIFLKSKSVKTLYYKSKNKKYNNKNLSFTVDTKKEYLFVKKICEDLYKEKKLNFDIKDLIKKIENPKVICFLNSNLGLSIFKKLIQLKVNIKLVVLHPDQNSNRSDEIKKLCKIYKIQTITPINFNLKNKKIFKLLKNSNADICLSVWSSFIFPENIINLFSRGIINLHNSFLPINKGSNANIYYLLNGDNPGVSLHYINTKIDSGPIIDQKLIECEISDTGYTLQKRMEKEMFKIFFKNWSKIKNYNQKINLKIPKGGNYNKKGKVYKLSNINLNKKYRAIDLINILRAFTYKGYPGTEFKYKNSLYDCKIIISKK